MATAKYLEPKEIEDFWTEVCRKCKVDDHVTRKWWKVIRDSYSEPQRFYHTLRHIGHMVWLIKHEPVISANIQSFTHVAVTVFFHDIVYDPKSKDNEDKSSELFLSFYTEAACQSIDGLLVHEYIMATKTHFTDEHSHASNNWGSTDMHTVLDLDMAILSVEQSKYNDYADKIRHEYCHHAEDVYCKRRIHVLEQFLTHRIYCCESVHKAWEESARQNILAEIIRLKEK